MDDEGILEMLRGSVREGLEEVDGSLAQERESGVQCHVVKGRFGYSMWTTHSDESKA